MLLPNVRSNAVFPLQPFQHPHLPQNTHPASTAHSPDSNLTQSHQGQRLAVTWLSIPEYKATPEFTHELNHYKSLISSSTIASWFPQAIEQLQALYPIDARRTTNRLAEYLFHVPCNTDEAIARQVKAFFNDKGALTGMEITVAAVPSAKSTFAFSLGNTLGEAFKWLTKDNDHTNTILPEGSIASARRVFRKILKEAGKAVVYVHNAQALDELESDVEIKDGSLTLRDGPFRQLLNSGGVLMLNVSGFLPQQLEAFNTMMEEQSWQGRILNNSVRIVFLCEKGSLHHNLLSNAQISRTTFQDMSGYAFPADTVPAVKEPLENYPQGTQIIDLEGDSHWSKRLFGGPEMDERQQWRHEPGVLDSQDFRHPVVIRNAPTNDPQLIDLLAQWREEGRQIRPEAGVSGQDIKRLAANKRPATDIVKQLQLQDSPVCIVNPSTINEVLGSHYGVSSNGMLKRLPPLIEQIREVANTGDPSCVYVTEPLPDVVWDRMMLHPADFNVAAAPGVTVPLRYAKHVEQVQKPHNNLDQDASFDRSVQFLLSTDPALVERNIPTESATRLFVTPATRPDELLCTMQREAATQGGTSSPRLRVQMSQFIDDLKAGKLIILHLENNPQLVSALSTLLHPPHYLYVNGERLHFGDNGELKGRVVVITANKDLVDSHPLSPVTADPIGEEKWHEYVVKTLQAQHPDQAQETIENQLGKLLQFFQILNAQNLMPAQTPSVNFPTLETLFRHLFGGSVPTVGDAPLSESNGSEAHLIRSLFKNLLIGDYYEAAQDQGATYAYLKICERVLFPEKMDLMPASSLNAVRLQELLQRVNHFKDFKHEVWRFLNVFSLDVIKPIIGEDLAHAGHTTDNIASQVLALVIGYANRQGWTVPPLLADEYRKLDEHSLASDKLQPYQPMPRASREQRSLDTAVKLLQQGNAVFLKGRPGTGKTHRLKNLTDGSTVYVANVADEASQVFHNQLESWAQDPGPATLVVDEANLARAENLAMLKGVFADRTLFVNGRVYPLSNTHRIIFTGNDDHVPGRNVQQVARESIPSVRHKAILDDVLRSAFIDPILDAAWEKLDQPLGDNLKIQIADELLYIHTHLQSSLPESELSARDLEEFAVQFATVAVASRTETINTQTAQAAMAWLALNVYTNDLPREDKAAVTAWLCHRYNLDRITPIEKNDINLRPTSLASTASTVDLANKIAWWLWTQNGRQVFKHKATTLGQSSLLIEGPASRGKDAVVTEVLRMQGWAFVHINANPSDLYSFRQALNDSRANGKVVVVSELNLLPSGILESELNALLAGQTDTPAAPGFALIATVNPGEYAGRKTLSSALKNRMQRIVVDDYQPGELAAIARKLADALPQKGGHRSIAWARISDDKIEALVDLHQQLASKLTEVPGEVRPGIRQLRKVLTRMQYEPASTVQSVFNQVYAYYISLSDSTTGSATPEAASQSGQSESTKRQLQRALRLAKPGWFRYPDFLPMNEEAASRALTYNADRHTINFNKQLPPDRLCAALLKEVNDGLHVFTPATVGTATVHSLKPALGTSAVGQEVSDGILGRIIGNRNGLTTYLRIAVETAEGRFVEFTEQVLSNDFAAAAAGMQVELENCHIDDDHGQHRIYLLSTHDTRPVNVNLNGQPAEHVYRDKYGGWYVRVEGEHSVIERVHYSLAPWKENLHPGASIEVGGIDLARNTQLNELVKTLRSDSSLDRATIATRLASFLKTAFIYSSDDATALNDTASLTERIQRFIDVNEGGGKGVCYEFSSTLALLLQTMNIPAQCVGGYATKNSTIPVQAHRWVEYLGSDGGWHTIDPTPPSRSTQHRSPTQQSEQSLVHDDVFYLDPDREFTPALLEYFSLEKLGLVDTSLQREGEAFNAFRGQLVVKRLLQGETKIFRDTSLTLVKKPRALYISEWPTFNDKRSKQQFLLRTLLPFQALLLKGARLHAPGQDGKFEEVSRATGWDLNVENVNTPPAPVVTSDDKLIVTSRNHNFFRNLETEYYGALLSLHKVDPTDFNGVKACIFSEWIEWRAYRSSNISKSNFESSIEDAVTELHHLLPLQLNLYGRSWEFTKKHLDDFTKSGHLSPTLTFRKIIDTHPMSSDETTPDKMQRMMNELDRLIPLTKDLTYIFVRLTNMIAYTEIDELIAWATRRVASLRERAILQRNDVNLDAVMEAINVILEDDELASEEKNRVVAIRQQFDLWYPAYNS